MNSQVETTSSIAFVHSRSFLNNLFVYVFLISLIAEFNIFNEWYYFSSECYHSKGTPVKVYYFSSGSKTVRKLNLSLWVMILESYPNSQLARIFLAVGGICSLEKFIISPALLSYINFTSFLNPLHFLTVFSTSLMFSIFLGFLSVNASVFN